MAPEASHAGWGGRVAVAVIRSDPPQVVLAESEAVLGRALALRVVAPTHPGRLPGGALEAIRAALLDERWADAVSEWMTALDEVVDAYPDEVVWTERDLDAEATALEIRLAPVFDDEEGRDP